MGARSFLRKTAVFLALMLSMLAATGCSDSSSAAPAESAQAQQQAAAAETQRQPTSQQQAKQQATDVAQQVLAAIGTAPDDQSSGAVSAKLEGKGRVLLGYRHYPLSAKNINNEIGIMLAPKLRKAFEQHSDLQAVTVNVYAPFQDQYGNTTWEKYVTFTFDRELYEKINWDNFPTRNLLQVAKDVEWHK